MNTLWKYLPIAVGVVLGFLLANPPAFLAANPTLRLAITVLIAAVVMVGFVAVVTLNSLPENLQFSPATKSLSPAAVERVHQFQQAGFWTVAGPWKVEIKPAATLIGLVHPNEPMVATVYETDTVPSRIGYDVVSMLDGDRGGVSTLTDVGAAVMPAAPGSFKQVFPGAPPASLAQAHQRALAELRRRGLSFRTLTASTLPGEIAASMRRQRRHFLRSPLWHTVVTLWRATTKTTPYLGDITAQGGFEERLRAIVTGRRG